MPRQTLLRSFACAFRGVFYVARTQRNARIHLVVGLFVIGAGWWLEISRLEWAILAITIGVMLVAETVNTVVETLVDLISPGPHPLAGVAKDVAAGVVLLLAATSTVVGLLILGPPLWRRWFA